MSVKRKSYSAEFKAKLVLEVLEGNRTINEIASAYEILPVSLKNWKQQFLENMSLAFDKSAVVKEYKDEIETLQKSNDELAKKVGNLTIEKDFLEGKLVSLASSSERKTLVDTKLELSLNKQCQLLHVSKSSLYYAPIKPFSSDSDIKILDAINNIYSDFPSYGYRRVHKQLLKDGYSVGKRFVKKAMKYMGIEALYPKPKTTMANKEHYKYEYLLKEFRDYAGRIIIEKTNQVWSTDITYIKLERGFVYLAAIIDWHSKKILSWKLSNTMDISLTTTVLKDALGIYPKPEIFNTEASQRVTVENSMQNQRIVIDLLNELKHSYISKNNFLEKFDKYTYKDIFVNINESSLEHNIKEIKTFLQENEFNFKDFKSDYIDKIKDETIGLKEVGIFYPFVLNHDIFKNSHFLFEINHLKFKKRTNHFFDIVENFYKKYEINHCLLKELFTLDDYFNYPDIENIDCFAYFDPFKHLAKYELKYKPIRENILKYKLDFQNFIFELFDFFNKAQIEIVRFQHLNLVDALIAARTQDRRYSVEELIKLQIKRVENGELPLLQGDELKFYYFVLLALENQSPGFRFKKNTKIDDLQNFEEMTIQEKQITQSILNDFLNVLNKDDSSKLQYIYNEYKNQLNIMMKKYKLSPSNKKIIYDMLLDLIYFYNDKDNEKLSRPFNSTIAKIYQKNQNKDVSKLIDINFKEKFKKQYRHYFDVYKPKSKLKEDVTTPHL